MPNVQRLCGRLTRSKKFLSINYPFPIQFSEISPVSAKMGRLRLISVRGRERKIEVSNFLLLMIPLWILHPGQLSILKWSCSGENLIIFFLVAENEFRFGGGGEYLQWRVIEDNCPNCQFDSTTKPVIMLMEKEEYAATWIKLCKIQNFWEISRDQRSFHPYFR